MNAYLEFHHHARWTSICHVIGFCIALIACGCGGGSGQAAVPAGGNVGAGQGGGAQRPPVGTGTVDVTVKHAFGDPAAGVSVTIWHPWGVNVPAFDNGGTTDEQGRVRFTNVPAGEVDVDVYVKHAGMELRAGADVQDLTNGQRIEFELVLYASGHDPSLGVIGTPDAAIVIGDSGRSLDWTTQVIDEVGFGGDGSFEIRLMDCEPDPDNDVPTPVAECVSGPGTEDVAYTADTAGEPTAFRAFQGGPAEPYAAALLVDMSRLAALNDPDNSRLYGMRYFLGKRFADTPVALGAFAADDIANGEHRELPSEPLTLLVPPFAAPDADLHTAIGALDGLQGGSAPLYAALTKMLDVIDADAPAGLPHAIVVLTDGRDDNCGDLQQCAAQRQSLAEKSRNASTRIIAVGYVTPDGDRGALDELTRETGGFTLWAEQPTQTALLLEKVGQFLDKSATTYEIDLGITSLTEGAFHADQVVLGTLHAQFLSGWGDSAPTTVPLRIVVP